MTKEAPMTTGQLEQALLMRFPAQDAESWDRTGLVVGDPARPVTAVAVALDPTVEAIKAAASQGANVLVTHHPPFLTAPDDFQPASSVAVHSGAGVYAAIESGVALMCFHTALDASRQAHAMLPGMLGLTQTGVLDPLPHNASKGYGQICQLPEGEAITLQQLAKRCIDAFSSIPRVWGNPETPLRSVVTGTGSASNLCAPAIQRNIDCLVVGELKYHASLDLSHAGVCIIELGHDVSELPLTQPLASAVSDICNNHVKVVRIDQRNNWYALVN